MSWFTGFALYFLFWWLTLFAVLPFGSRSQAEEGVVEPGTDPGAPSKPKLLRRFIWNSIVAGILFGIYWYITSYLGYGFSDIPMIVPK